MNEFVIYKVKHIYLLTSLQIKFAEMTGIIAGHIILLFGIHQTHVEFYDKEITCILTF